jgi:hypothetical protein
VSPPLDFWKIKKVNRKIEVALKLLLLFAYLVCPTEGTDRRAPEQIVLLLLPFPPPRNEPRRCHCAQRPTIRGPVQLLDVPGRVATRSHMMLDRCGHRKVCVSAKSIRK